jgi:hypothetical protein
VKSITLTVYNRPDSLTKVLDSLYQNKGTEEYDLFIGLEPVNEKCREICHSIDKNRFNGVHILENKWRLGINSNPYNLLETALNLNKSQLNIHLEDDLCAAKDVIHIANLYPDSILGEAVCLCLTNPETLTDWNYKGDPHLFYYRQAFVPTGLIMTKHQWKKHIQPYWFSHPTGWDFGIYHHVKREELYCSVADVNRTKHIAAGCHVNEDMQRDKFGLLPFYDGEKLGRYVFRNGK